MEKTIKEWLNELPEEYRDKAIQNSINLNDSGAGTLTKTRESLRDALQGGFVWDKSPEGHIYWSDLDDRLKQQNIPTEAGGNKPIKGTKWNVILRYILLIIFLPARIVFATPCTVFILLEKWFDWVDVEMKKAFDSIKDI